jgi:hypothetical protein
VDLVVDPGLRQSLVGSGLVWSGRASGIWPLRNQRFVNVVRFTIMVNQPRLPRINVDATLSCCLGSYYSLNSFIMAAAAILDLTIGDL